MAKGKIGKTFLEVHGSLLQEGNVSGSKRESKEIPPDFPLYEGEDLLVISDIADRVYERGRGEISGRGRAAAIIIIASICGIGLAIGMFFLGHSVGRVETPREEITARAPAAVDIKVPEAKKVPPAVTETERRIASIGEQKHAEEAAPTTKGPSERAATVEEKPPAKAAAAAPVVPPPTSVDTWTLRVISYTDVQKNLEKAANVADILQSTTGHDAFVARFGNKLVVCLGEFDSKGNAELLELQKFVREFEYENKRPFITSYPVRIK